MKTTSLSSHSLFSQRLFEQIRLSKKSVNQIERELGYPRNAISNYKNGGEPSGSRLIELSKYLGVSPEYLIGYSSNPNSISIVKIFEDLKPQQKLEMETLCRKWILDLWYHSDFQNSKS